MLVLLSTPRQSKQNSIQFITLFYQDNLIWRVAVREEFAAVHGRLAPHSMIRQRS